METQEDKTRQEKFHQEQEEGVLKSGNSILFGIEDEDTTVCSFFSLFLLLFLVFPPTIIKYWKHLLQNPKGN